VFGVSRGFGPLVAAALVAALSSTACTSDETRARPAVPTAGAATGDLFLRGTVHRDGKAVSGASVDLGLWDATEAAPAEIGDRAEMFSASKAITDDRGAFTLRLKADEVPSKYFEPGGRDVLNFEIHLVDGNTLGVWSSTMVPEGHPAVWRTSEDAAPADAVLRADFDLGTGRLTTIDSLDQKATDHLLVIR
jgi:hypothetical protein